MDAIVSMYLRTYTDSRRFELTKIPLPLYHLELLGLLIQRYGINWPKLLP